MRTLIRDVTAITLDEKDRILHNVKIAIEGKDVLAVGQASSGFVPDEVIDCREHVALPGFFDSHTHAAMTLERGWAEDQPFNRWLNEKIRVAESALEEEVENSLPAHGKTPVAHLASLGVFDVPAIAAHCITVSNVDKNDENLLIIHDSEVAAPFVEEFGRVCEQARTQE